MALISGNTNRQSPACPPLRTSSPLSYTLSILHRLSPSPKPLMLALLLPQPTSLPRAFPKLLSLVLAYPNAILAGTLNNKMAPALRKSRFRQPQAQYEDQGPPSSFGRRPTGFSSPDSAPPPSYNSVPPPLDGIEMAKQRAQEIAARLTASASLLALRLSALVSKRLWRIGLVLLLGKLEKPLNLQMQSGAKIQIQRDMDADPNSVTRPVELTGNDEEIAKAEQLINDVLAEAEAGGSGIVSRRLTGHAGSEHFEMKIPNNKVGLVIGKGGETIKICKLELELVIPLHLPPGDPSTERTLHIDGTSEQIKNARELVDEVISEVLDNMVIGSLALVGIPLEIL
ncbi:hypothetical protein F3Y22_tig00110201pilonHSYRG00045 [Hibiscus syriacus]|uniref:K Homology domain-containing protein n=1 Tax=Hibiscus syriacus TaxID=106335 RepID=A0A6A3BDC1_HIBSY|nr:hypothetical protein F3Y22_tig00110201pilonHSYRG00045 [Hibiscus syriacus]